MGEELRKNSTFPLPPEVKFASCTFEYLEDEMKTASPATIDPDEMFAADIDDSDFALVATLNQNGQPVAFFSRSLNTSEIGKHPVEKEACAIVESLILDILSCGTPLQTHH